MPKDERLQIRVPRAEKLRLQQIAEERGWSLSQLVREGARHVSRLQAAA